MFDYSKNPFTLNHHYYIDQMTYEGMFDNISSCIDNIFYMSRDIGPTVPFGVIRGYVDLLLSGQTNPYRTNTLAWHHYEWGRECARKNTYLLDNHSVEDYAYG
jgi:hypothetical protein